MKDLVLGGRYRILDRIGEGGMAFVYLALDEKLDRQVAIKVLHDHMSRNEELRERFHAEARAASSLDHPNIVNVYDFSGADSPTLWIVTELLRGVNLAQFAKRFPARQLHPALAGLITRETCRALETAHLHGIVHRDIKPENIMMTDSGVIKLMDFGISKNLQRDSVTLSGTFMGSPSYMSPEQTRGVDVDHRSDIYSLGVLFYELLTGRLPFTGQTTSDVIMKIAHGVFTPPRAFVPMLEPRLEAMVLKAMAREPHSRYKHITELGQEIDHLLSEHGFVESHVELRRYFADRILFETRLARIRGLGGSAGAAANQPTRVIPSIESTPRPIEKTPAPSMNSSASVATIPIMMPASAPTEVNPPIPVAPAVQPPPAPPIPAPPMAPAAASGNHAARPAQRQPATPPRREPMVAPRLPTARPAAGRSQRPSTPRVHVVYRESHSNRVIGIGLIGLIFMMAVWAVIALDRDSRQLRHPKLPPSIQKITRDEPAPPAPSRIDPPTRSDRLPVRANVSTKPSASQTHDEVVAPRSTKDSKRSAQKPSKTATNPRIARQSTSPGVPVKAPSAPVSAKIARVTTPVEMPVAPPPPAITTSDAGAAMGAIALSSHPAAEIFVDGLRVGTTIDRTTSSAWIPLKSGRHQFELRRPGFESYRDTIIVAAGSRQSLDPIVLEPSEAPTNCTLTVLSEDSATVSIRGVDTAFRVDTRVTGGKALVRLPAGQFRVRVDVGGIVREKTITLSEISSSLTFNATVTRRAPPPITTKPEGP